MGLVSSLLGFCRRTQPSCVPSECTHNPDIIALDLELLAVSTLEHHSSAPASLPLISIPEAKFDKAMEHDLMLASCASCLSVGVDKHVLDDMSPLANLLPSALPPLKDFLVGRDGLHGPDLKVGGRGEGSGVFFMGGFGV